MAIQISIANVRESCDHLKQQSQQMMDTLEAIKQKMILVQHSFESEASDEFQNRFRLFSKRFLEMRDTIQSYIQFLEMTTSSYESLDASLKGNANGMQV
ncbi:MULTISPECIES: WXG100 family type VII secretion target [Terrabacteria group]|uniref:WXG100 family type VII secretion target n=1 Tax=Bacillati TaxID=1783272 RepID=UPI0019392AC5|nr:MULTISPECIES: WXG100 family type VII secretion target [Terrabacteria group]MBW9211877.1 WXG100 family type VII secretion target [Trueperella sp. zg.1013]QRG87319.1 WXG100 family type VII secretion target [Bulleidia sp. zg-1006]